MSDVTDAPQVLMCNEVWGGNRKVVRAVQMPGVSAWVASLPIDDDQGGGDLYYMSVCSHDLISRIALADVSGHGSIVSATTETLPRLMRENVDVWDQSDFMQDLNDTFVLNSQHKYATAIVMSIHRTTGALAFSNAGHLPPLWYHTRRKTWGWLEEEVDPLLKRGGGLPIGLIRGTHYVQTVVTLEPSDLLVLYTDGVTEAVNDAGQSLDRDQVFEWAREMAIDSPEALGQSLLQRLEFFHGDRRNDDQTMIVLQREPESVSASLDKAAVDRWMPAQDQPDAERAENELNRGQ